MIRVLGRYKFIDDIFALFSTMRALKIEPNDESYEFLSASLVATVREESTATTMKDLPSPDPSLPEIVFAGRSNVGKSSLVNFLVGRKVSSIIITIIISIIIIIVPCEVKCVQIYPHEQIYHCMAVFFL